MSFYKGYNNCDDEKNFSSKDINHTSLSPLREKFNSIIKIIDK